MARFRYIGEFARGDMGAQLTVKKLRVHLDGQFYEFNAPKPGLDLGVEITSDRSLRILRLDPRFEEIGQEKPRKLRSTKATKGSKS
jgi:hypothetical protein